jgi:hypothetical protein
LVEIDGQFALDLKLPNGGLRPTAAVVILTAAAETDG